MKLPPIMKRPGLRFVGIEEKRGMTTLVFATDDTNVVGDGYVRVTMILPGKALFVYTLYDPETATIRHFEGRYGDPERDSWEIIGAD